MQVIGANPGNRTRLAAALSPLVMASFAAATTFTLAGRSPKIVVGAFGFLGMVAVGIWTGTLRPILLGGWAFALTYNRQFFLFDGVTGHPGAHGPYLILADAFLLLAAFDWAAKAVLRKPQPEAAASAGTGWLIPFLTVSVISGLFAAHPSWSFFELLRLLRIIFLLGYMRSNAGPREWWACVAGIGCGVFAQGLLGTAEIVTGRTGVLGVLGFGNLEAAAPSELREEAFYGWRRATGTMSHPPNLACYFIMMIPVLVCLSMRAPSRKLRISSAIAALSGLAGLACTLSRWPVALMIAEFPVILLGLSALRLIDVKRAIGLLVLASFAGLAAAVPLLNFISDRLTRDLDRSIDFRRQENETGWKVAWISPIWGVGPNNYSEYLYALEPSWEWARQYERISTDLLHIRPIASPHDGFLLILAETGFLGLTTFAVFIFGSFRAAVCAIRNSNGPVRAVCWGLTVGLAALLLQQAVDFSIWADPLLYSLGLAVALFHNVPAQAEEAGDG